jgi:hypothetical protein
MMSEMSVKNQKKQFISRNDQLRILNLDLSVWKQEQVMKNKESEIDAIRLLQHEIYSNSMYCYLFVVSVSELLRKKKKKASKECSFSL